MSGAPMRALAAEAPDVAQALRELALQAGLGATPEALAPGLHAVHQQSLAAGAPPAERLARGGTLLKALCALPRWAEPSRSAAPVPPLAVVLWHVGRSFGSPWPGTLWLDFVLPRDARRAAATEWAHEIRLLLALAQIPHRAETVLMPAEGQATGVASPLWGDAPTWGCQSLLHAYQLAGEPARRVLR